MATPIEPTRDTQDDYTFAEQYLRHSTAFPGQTAARWFEPSVVHGQLFARRVDALERRLDRAPGVGGLSGAQTLDARDTAPGGGPGSSDPTRLAVRRTLASPP
jgi:hypothetical protein